MDGRYDGRYHTYEARFIGDMGRGEEVEGYIEDYERAAERLDMDEVYREVRTLGDLFRPPPFRMREDDREDISDEGLRSQWGPLGEDDPVMAAVRFTDDAGRRIQLQYHNTGLPQYCCTGYGDGQVRQVLEEETGRRFYRTDDPDRQDIDRLIDDLLPEGDVFRMD